jgi:hypothetical protein
MLLRGVLFIFNPNDIEFLNRTSKFEYRKDIIPSKYQNDLEEKPTEKFNSDFIKFVNKYKTNKNYDVYEVKDYLEPIELNLKINKTNSGNNFFGSNLENYDEEEQLPVEFEDEDSEDEENQNQTQKEPKSNLIYSLPITNNLI